MSLDLTNFLLPGARPVIITATVTKAYSPVIGAEVTATVESTNQTLLLELRDDGVNGDIAKDDGTYTGLLLNTDNIGKHSVSVSVKSNNEAQIKSTVNLGRAGTRPGK